MIISPSSALIALCQVYKYWIAYADLDGFRIDTVKHMDLGAVPFFASVIHEFAQAHRQRKLLPDWRDHRRAAAGLSSPSSRPGWMQPWGSTISPTSWSTWSKDIATRTDYFDLFRNSMLVQKESHIWFRNHVVTLFDDHDQVRKGGRKPASAPAIRAGGNCFSMPWRSMPPPWASPASITARSRASTGRAIATATSARACLAANLAPSARAGRHFFNEEHPVYQELAKILASAQEKIALRRGRQYLREISG